MSVLTDSSPEDHDAVEPWLDPPVACWEPDGGPRWGWSFVQLRHYRARTMLAIVGVALAVLAGTLLAALGLGVLSAGPAGIESIGGDVWPTPQSLAFAPGAVGGIETDLHDAHWITADVDDRDDVLAARGVYFQSVYVGTSPGEYEPIIGVDVTGDGVSFNVETGESFSGGDEHYADGGYDGPLSMEVLLDSPTAGTLGVEVGDEIHACGTLVAADEHTFTVVGITDDVRQYIGAPTVIFHLAELQQVSGTTRKDSGTAVLVAVGAATVLQAVEFVNEVVADLTGFEELLLVPPWLLAGSFGLALGVGVLGAAVAGWLVTRVAALEHLRN